MGFCLKTHKLIVSKLLKVIKKIKYSGPTDKQVYNSVLPLPSFYE